MPLLGTWIRYQEPQGKPPCDWWGLNYYSRVVLDWMCMPTCYPGEARARAIGGGGGGRRGRRGACRRRLPPRPAAAPSAAHPAILSALKHYSPHIPIFLKPLKPSSPPNPNKNSS